MGQLSAMRCEKILSISKAGKGVTRLKQGKHGISPQGLRERREAALEPASLTSGVLISRLQCIRDRQAPPSFARYNDGTSKAVWRCRFPPHSKDQDDETNGHGPRQTSWRLLTAAAMLMASISPLTRAENAPGKFTFERGIMATRFAITCYDADSEKAKTAAQAAFDAAEKINQVASDYIADSELLELTKHPSGQSVATSPLLFKLISEAYGFAKKTDGRFDPTLGPLTKLWRESRRQKALPDDTVLAQARSVIGWKNLTLDTRLSTIVFAKNGMRLDLGGIAKGQAADAMLAVMADKGISRCCITAGGDVRLGDPPPGAEGWNVQVHAQENGAGRLLTLSNCAVSTSGELHQFIEIGGTRYSHIIDPATGLGLTRTTAATVIAPNATTSDALATACCVASPDISEKMALAAGATEVILSD
jgi:thiamine biosynthesis lipoprotein